MTMLPPDVQYGYVRGHFALAVGDTTWDEDRLPDEIPAEGTFVFEPLQSKLVSLADNDPTTILMRPITCTLVNGLLYDPTGAEGVWLVAGQYRVRAALVGVSYPSGVIEVTTAHTPENPLDLSLAIPMGTPTESHVVAPWAVGVLEVRDQAIVDGDVVGDDLLLTRQNGVVVNAGNVRGGQGERGLPGLDAMPQAEGMSEHISTPGLVRDAVSALIREKQPFVNAADYGVTAGTGTSMSSALQAVIDSAASFGFAVYLPGGVYRIDTQVTLRSGVTLFGVKGSTVLDISAIPDGIPAFVATGTLGSAQALAADLAEGATTMTPTDATGLAVGDYVKISSSQPFGSTSQPRGEFVRIRSVEAGVVTFEDPLHDSYPVASDGKFEKATFVEDVTVEGVELSGPSSTRNVIAASFTLCRNLSLQGVRSKNAHNAAVQMSDVIESSVSDCHFADSKLSGFAYGVAILYASQDITVTNCTGVRLRHMVTTGGGTGRRGVSRRIAVSNCTASQMDDAGFDAHPATEYVSFIGCHVNGSAQDGIVMQASRFVVSGCTVSSATRYGILVQPLTVRGVDGIIANNRVNGGGTRGLAVIISATVDYQTWSGLAVTGNVVTDATLGLAVENTSTTFSVPGVVVANNIVRRTKGSHGIQLRGLTAPVVNGNHVSGSGSTSEAMYLFTCPESVVSGNVLDGAGVSMRSLRLAASPDSTITGNVLRGAVNQGILTDASSNNLIYMGNRNLCTVKGSLSGTGHIQSTADAAGAYNL